MRASAAVMMMLALIGVACAQDEDKKQAAALQATMAKVIQQNESAIACILVSRSEAYSEFGQGPSKDQAGKLGAFDVKALETNPRFFKLTGAEQKQWRKQLDFTDPAYVPRAFGSGVVVDGGEGLILTNYHVIQDATKLFVRLPGGKYGYADIHAADPRCDLAVLRLLNKDALPLQAITLGDADKLQRGHFILTLANPFAGGFRDGQPSASWGILSATRRRATRPFKEEERVKPLHYYGTLLQTDARLHVGCSGGALLNLSGELVGLTTSIAAIQGDDTPGGFSIPINANMHRILDVLKRGEEIDYGFLGVGFNEKNGNGKLGVQLTLVGRGSPAAVDGKLQDGDTILEINGVPIHEPDDIFVTIGTQLAGTKVKLHVLQKDGKHMVDVTLGKLQVPGKRIASSMKSRPFYRGLRVDYSSLVAQPPISAFSIPAGVLISDVQVESAADRAKLKSGDVITHVNGLAVTTPAAFYSAVVNVAGGLELTLYNPPPEPSTKVMLKP